MTKIDSENLSSEVQRFLDEGGEIEVLPPSKVNSELKHLDFGYKILDDIDLDCLKKVDDED